jgi:hypothetical protein
MGQPGSDPMKFLSNLWQSWQQDRSDGQSHPQYRVPVQQQYGCHGAGGRSKHICCPAAGCGRVWSARYSNRFCLDHQPPVLFRMGELVVKYLGLYLVEERRDRAGAVVKVAALVEAASSLLAFLVLIAIAPLAAIYLAKDASTTPFFMIYGISILGTSMAEVATGVLQVDNRFRSQAMVNLAQSILTALIILGAFLSNAGMLVSPDRLPAGQAYPRALAP